ARKASRAASASAMVDPTSGTNGTPSTTPKRGWAPRCRFSSRRSTAALAASRGAGSPTSARTAGWSSGSAGGARGRSPAVCAPAAGVGLPVPVRAGAGAGAPGDEPASLFALQRERAPLGVGAHVEAAERAPGGGGDAGHHLHAGSFTAVQDAFKHRSHPV